MTTAPFRGIFSDKEIDVTAIWDDSKQGIPDQSAQKNIMKGDYVFLPGEFADRVYLVVKGKVKIGSYSDDGKEITKDVHSEGEVFGELALSGLECRNDYAIALENTVIKSMKVSELKRKMRINNDLNIFLLNLMGKRLMKMENRLESLVFKDSRTRIIDFLKNLADEKGQRVGYEILVRNFMTHQEIANYTATSRQTVTTILNQLRNENILTFNRKRLLIRDMDRLK